MNKITKFTALGVAALFVSFTLTACVPQDTPPEPTDEGYRVVLNYNDSISRPHTLFVSEGESMTTPAEPLREGYEIDHWATALTGGTEVTFPYTPSGDTTLYAQWKPAVYDVTFDYNFEGSTPYVVPVEYNKTVEAPDESAYPERSGFRLYRWDNRAEDGDAVAFPYTVRRDVTFYAHWLADDIKIFTVSFDINYSDGETYEPLDIIQGESLNRSQLPTPERSSYKFEGWATTPDATKDDVITFPYEVTESLTLYGVWTRAAFNVRFRYNYANAPTENAGIYYSIPASSGDVIEEGPEELVRENFEFQGWYTAAVGGDKIEFPYTATGRRNIDLYAHWVSVPVTTNIFDAEFTPISNTLELPGHSGEAHGVEIIQPDADGTLGAHSEPYPFLNQTQTQLGHVNRYVSYLHRYGASLTFNIYSDRAVSDAQLIARLASEELQNLVFTPEGEYGFSVTVNGTALNYGQISFVGEPNVSTSGLYASAFKDFRLGSISLNEGWNEIVLMTNNNHAVSGSTMTAIGPRVDYIRIETSATLSWRPEYDNLYRSR